MIAAIEARWATLSNVARGITWMLMGAAAFSVSAVLVKLVGARLSTIEISFFRCLFGFIAVIPFVVREGPSVFRTSHAWLHVSRSAVGIGAMMASFYSFVHLPLATASAISFTKPLFITLLGALLLRENVHWRRWAATAIGFIGVLIVIRPTPDGIDPAAGVAVLGAALVAWVALLIKTMTATERPITILAWFSIGTTLLLAGPTAWVWVQPTPVELALLVAVGITSATAQGWLIKAYQAAEASVVAPFDYTRLLFATLFGYLAFAELPDAWAYAGAGLVMAASIYTARREAKATAG